MMENNWDNFLKNLGEWQGSFTKVSLTGELLESTPSILSLKSLEENQLVRFRLRRFATGNLSDPPTTDYEQEYRSLGRQIIFFETGAFSKGSIQLAPFSECGAEYGFVAENRRLRFVQLYDNQGQLNSLTLIREFRTDTAAQERPPLSVEQLLGTWEGIAHTAYADWQPSVTYSTRLEIQSLGDGHLQQQLSFGNDPPSTSEQRTISSTARIEGNRLLFEDGPVPRQLLLLPDGASSNTPMQIQRHQPLMLELGWLVEPNERQRLIRSYNEKGEWVSATHVIERKIGK
jgi:hypothetical protein